MNEEPTDALTSYQYLQVQRILNLANEIANENNKKGENDSE